jgi:adenine-specific DNA methylase
MPATRRAPEPVGTAPGHHFHYSLLDAGGLPVEQLALLAQREGRRPVAIYHAHRWFARRFSSAFRAVLVAALTPPDGDFWAGYYQGIDYAGLTVLDPFVGGGTSVVEAARLGASTIGVDIDPVACAITRFELNAAESDGLADALARLQQSVGGRLAPYYTTRGPQGECRRVLHGFWVQTVRCQGCRQALEAHPHFQLAFEAEGVRQWVFCRACHAVHELERSERFFKCRQCGEQTVIASGPVVHGDLVCPHCSTREPLIDVAGRTQSPPCWRLFALETIPAGVSRRVPMAQRSFQAATGADQERARAARRALRRRGLPAGGWRWVPDRQVPREGRSDDRLLDYGYRHYHQLFNPRQLLHLSRLAEAISATAVGRVREALALAFSDHLATNCMLTYYAFGWRRLAPLFSIRAFRHVSRPVEINPWLDGTGRGTFPNAVRQVQRAIDFARAPEVAHLDGGFVRSGSLGPVRGQTRHVIHGDSRVLARVKDRSVDLILTDPPYFDNIAYSELSDFFLPWLQAFGLIQPRNGRAPRMPANLAARSRGEEGLSTFQRGLTRCFAQMHRVLKDEGRLVFSYQHRTPEAWAALACALAEGGWVPVQVFPMLGNSTAGPHQHEGTITWDAVSVYRKGASRPGGALRVSRPTAGTAARHVRAWSSRVSGLAGAPFRAADRTNLWRACLVAAALGMFGAPRGPGPRLLREVLVEENATI